MNPEFNLTLNIAQLVTLGGLVWGLANMSASVKALRGATDKLTEGMTEFGHTLADMVSRVRVLEDRTERRRSDRP